MRRRHKLQVNTFPFLAVLLCAMGSLILVLLVMDRRSHLAARARAQEQQRRLAEGDALAKGRQRADYESKKRSRDVAWEKKRDALRARVNAEENTLTGELREVQERLAKTAQRLKAEETTAQKLRDQIKEEQGRVTKQEELLQTGRDEAAALADKAASADKARAKLAAELVQLEKLFADLKTAREREAQTFSVIPYQGKRGDNRQPLYIECDERGFIVHPDQLKLDSPSEEALRAELIRRIARQQSERAAAGEKEARPYLMLLVRPDGIRRFYELQAAARTIQVDFGYEFVNAEWKFHIPETPSPIKRAEVVKAPSPAPPAPAPAGGNATSPPPNIGLTRPVPYGSELPPIGGSSEPLASGGREPPVAAPQTGGLRPPLASITRNTSGEPTSPDGNIVSMHRPVTRPATRKEDGIPTPALLPLPVGQSASSPSGPNPPGSSTGSSGNQSEPAGPRLGPSDPEPRQLPLRPAQISGVREVVVFVECRADLVVVYPTRTRITIEHLTHSAMHNKLYQTVRTLIARQQTHAPEAKVQVRFLIHRDAERTFHRAYPVLEGLAVPKTQYHLMPDDDIARILAGS